MTLPIIGFSNPMEWLMLLAGLMMFWIIVSIPVHLVGKILISGKSRLIDAMNATIFGPIGYVATLFTFNYFFGAIAYSLSLFLAFAVWVCVFKVMFKSSWLAALARSIFAIFAFGGLSLLFATTHGITVSAPFLPQF